MPDAAPRRLRSDELPLGVAFGYEFEPPTPGEDETGFVLPDRLIVCMRVRDGFPKAPATIKDCRRCGEPIYRSKRGDQEMPCICYQCADLLAPWWRNGHA